MIEITINGINRTVSKGLTIMQACEYYNITIPHFCYHDKLSIAGNCRMCLVEVVENPWSQRCAKAMGRTIDEFEGPT